MMEKIGNNINCGSGDVFVSYIYDELTVPERRAFEDHLLDCTACTDEFAAVADSRYAVYEWQKLEFEPMPTPEISIPYSEPKVAWFESVKRIFAIPPRLATAGAFALVLLAVGLAAVFMSTGPTDVISIDTVRVTETLSEPVAQINVVETDVVTESDEPAEFSKPDGTVAEADAPNVSRRKLTPTRSRTVKRPEVRLNETQANAPRLNDFEDITDESLRLADLVADVDTND